MVNQQILGANIAHGIDVLNTNNNSNENLYGIYRDHQELNVLWDARRDKQNVMSHIELLQRYDIAMRSCNEMVLSKI